MNNVSLLGRIATDLEMKRTQNNKSYISFSLAVDRFSNGNKTADFIRCTAWGKNAENIVKYFSKGSLIAVNGSIRTANYTDRNGANRFVTGVSVSSFYFTGSTKEQNTASSDNSYHNNNYSNQKKNNNYPNNNSISNYNFGKYSADRYNGYPEYDGYCY